MMNDAKLDEYYKDFVFDSTSDNYYDMWTKLIRYNIALMYKQLTATQSDRYDFIGQPGTVNAWYMVGFVKRLYLLVLLPPNSL
ncbi:hypothetical protein OESDEN_04191 [Oesophagostomum dentatum]|uniref:Peptidase M13 N-terminal domain-containing protein n=1 Tax=Oesophagostomum dentatum TaxID=61180 RepID=A0A0B1TIC6_OESDE|nr:hypothetical protein OESDEN_04191 [Oesophagostomum dentatum]